MPLTGSLLFVYICMMYWMLVDPVEGRCWDAINR